MNQNRIVIALLLLPAIMCVMLTCVPLLAHASNSQNELVSQIEEALDISVFYHNESERLIKCFDVNENGFYAIGCKDNTIHIFNSDGIFQYGYRFTIDGTYGIDLKENNIIIYLGRSNTAVEVNSAGECVAAETIHFSKDMVDNIINRTYKQIENTHYYLERDIGIFNGDYSRLVKNDETGNQIILYDVTTLGYFAGICHYLLLSIFPIAGIVFIIKATKSEDKHNLFAE